MARITHAASHLPVEEVKARMKNDSRPWCRNRWLIIYNALVDPREATEIAKHTGVTVSTVHNVIADYNRFGVAAVETPGKGGWRSGYLTNEEERGFLQPFFDRAAKGEIATAAQIKQGFEQRIGHKVHKTTIYRLLDRHQWRKVVPRPSHPQANKEEQEQFKQHFPQLVEEVVKARDPKDERPVLKMAQDEACFGRISMVKRSWAPKHIRPLVPNQMIREYTYAYAVVAPKEGKMTSLILPTADTAMMNLFLEHVSRTFSQYFLVIQVDQAGWHNGKDLVLPENIRLIPQPASSPELNPVEHLWEEIREKAFYNCPFSSLESVTDTLCDQLRQLEDNEQILRAMTYFPHFRMAS